MPLTLSKITGQVLGRMFLNLGLSAFPCDETWIWGKNATEVMCPFHCVIAQCQHLLLLITLTLIIPWGHACQLAPLFYLIEAIQQVQLMFKVRGIKLHLPGGLLKSFWTYVKTTTTVNKYHGEILWGNANILFPLGVWPADLFQHPGADPACSNYK